MILIRYDNKKFPLLQNSTTFRRLIQKKNMPFKYRQMYKMHNIQKKQVFQIRNSVPWRKPTTPKETIAPTI